MTSVPMYRCSILCVGITKRCRKVSRHRLELGRLPLDVDPGSFECFPYRPLGSSWA